MKSQTEAEEDRPAQRFKVDAAEGPPIPAQRFKAVAPANLKIGKQYRINQNGHPHETDRLGVYIGVDPVYNNPRFDDINAFDVAANKRTVTKTDTGIRFPQTYFTYYESGKTIWENKFHEHKGVSMYLLHGYGSGPVKRRTIRRRRRHRTIKRRYVAI
jgi:hypothetical protein